MASLQRTAQVSIERSEHLFDTANETEGGFKLCGGSMRLTSLFLILLFSIAVLGAKPTGDIPVIAYFDDVDASGTAYYIQNDGFGAYQNGVQGVSNVLAASTYHNWTLDTGSRNITVTLSSANAVQPGQPGYQAPANPPFWGTQTLPGVVRDYCGAVYQNILAMAPGQVVQCPATVRFPSSQKQAYYRLHMTGSSTALQPAAPETTEVQIQCNSVGGDGQCSDWFIDPIPHVNPDGTTSAGTAIARLVEITTNGQVSDDGDFYVTFHVHLIR